MIIKNKRNEMARFDSINEGDVFIIYNEDICMKTETTYCDENGDYENAVNLANGNLSYIRNDTMVKVIKCELIID